MLYVQAVFELHYQPVRQERLIERMIVHDGKYYPDVFLAGAPKSGTTFLFHPLAKHTGICASYPKETDFYLDNENPHKKSEKQRAKRPYRSYFDSSSPGGLHLDGTQWTIYQTDLIKKIAQFETKPKLLFLFREPAKRILSSFQYTSNNISAVGDMSFSQYVDYLLSKDHDAIISRSKTLEAAYSLINELKFSDYQYYLDQWQDAVGLERMKIFLFEDMKHDPAHCYSEVCRFLELPEEPMQLDSEQMNKSVEIKNKSVHYVLHKLYGLTGYKVPFKKQIKLLYGSLQYKQGRNKADFQVDLERLKAHFKPLNEKLALAYDLDLTAWH